MSPEKTLQLQRHLLITDIQALFASEPCEDCVLAILDIRDFRELNHSFGIAFGDAVLSEISARLEGLALDDYSFYYLGNDEFAILLPRPVSPGLALVKIENILGIFLDPFNQAGHSVKVTVNCGIVNNFEKHAQASQLLFDAEIALKQAKAANRPYLWLEKEQQQTSSRSKWRLLNSLHQAIEDEQLSLYWQPKVPLQKNITKEASGRAQQISAEALVRWETEDQGVLAPKITLPLIEHLGSEIELIGWMLNNALKHLSQADTLLAAEQSKNTLQNRLKPGVSINIPPSVETIEALESLVSEALAIWHIDPERLTLEITEEILINDKKSVFEKLNKVRATGVNISIDDFGTGYSSLAYFKHIPADELKIDQSFIHSMLENEADRKIVGLIIDIAHAFDLSVIAEGVEDEKTAAMLAEMGCDYAQGFLFCKPIPFGDYLCWLQDNIYSSAQP